MYNRASGSDGFAPAQRLADAARQQAIRCVRHIATSLVVGTADSADADVGWSRECVFTDALDDGPSAPCVSIGMSPGDRLDVPPKHARSMWNASVGDGHASQTGEHGHLGGCPGCFGMRAETLDDAQSEAISHRDLSVAVSTFGSTQQFEPAAARESRDMPGATLYKNRVAD